jgi:hypothetical protein
MAAKIIHVPHPSGSVIQFNASFHVYSMKGQKLRSVSSILNGYFPFDADKIAEIAGRKSGKTAAQMKDEWKLSASLGTNVHAHIEAMLKKQPPPKPVVLQGQEDRYYPVAEAAVNKLLKEYEVIAVETIVASERLRLAGTIDFLARNRQTGAIMVGDWKTTSAAATGFKFSSFESPCKGMLSHLPNAKMTRYALQTLAYGHILKEERYDKLIDPAIASMPLEYGLVKFGPNETNEIVAEFTMVQESDLAGVDDGASLPVSTLVRRVCMQSNSLA